MHFTVSMYKIMFANMYCVVLMLLFWSSPVLSEELFDMFGESGSVLCQFLADLERVERGRCAEPKCHWSNWTNTKASTNKIVLSYSHNGFGNQLWEHSFAGAVASSIGARLLVGLIPESLYVGDSRPSHTSSGFHLMSYLLRSEFEYEPLSLNSSEKLLCESEPFVLAARPADTRRGSLTRTAIANLTALLQDPKPRCLKMIGYFQENLYCEESAKSLWSLQQVLDQVELINITSFEEESKRPHRLLRKVESKSNTPLNVTYSMVESERWSISSVGRSRYRHQDNQWLSHNRMMTEEYIHSDNKNYPKLIKKLVGHDAQMSLRDLIALQKFPGPNDISVYLRCAITHYHFNDPLYYEIILNRTKYDKIWVFESPDCADTSHRKVAVVNPTRKYLYGERNATKLVWCCCVI